MTSERRMPCPMCHVALRPERHAVLGALVCPQKHGLLLAEENLREVVGEGTVERLHDLVEAGLRTSYECPSCLQKLYDVGIQGVPARGCAVCGSLWFDRGAVEGHVREVRRRELGVGSFAAREDVERLGTSLQPTEIVAGLLAYYDLEPIGAPKRA